jgi:hypothetical protein
MVLLGAALAALGTALGAASQHEGFLRGEIEDDIAAGTSSGGVVVLTAFLVAVGIAAVFVGLSRSPLRARIAPAIVVVVVAWLTVVLWQLDFPNLTALHEFRRAEMVQSHIIHAASASPSTVTPLLCLAYGGLAATVWAARRVVAGPRARPGGPASAYARLTTATVAAVPFLLVTAIGLVLVLLGIPADEPRAALATVLLPVAALAAIGLACVLLLRLWPLHAWTRDPRRADAVRDAWRILDRIQWGLVAALVATAALSAFLPARDTPETSLGRAFVMTLRSHGLSMALLLIPVAPAIALARRIGKDAGEWTAHRAVAAHPSGAVMAVSAGAVLAAALAFTGSALLPWLAGLGAAAIFALRRVAPSDAMPIAGLWAWTLWAVGDTISAVYDGNVFPPLQHATAPGLLALWRIAAAIVGATALSRALVEVSEEPRTIAIPLAIAASVGAAIFALLEYPLAVWALRAGEADAIAVGSLVASQSEAVRAVMHAAAALLLVASAAVIARLLRPDWFRPRTGPAETSAAASAADAQPMRPRRRATPRA